MLLSQIKTGSALVLFGVVGCLVAVTRGRIRRFEPVSRRSPPPLRGSPPRLNLRRP